MPTVLSLAKQMSTEHCLESREQRGKDNKNTEVTPLYNHVYPSKNTAKHQWSRAWPHQLAPLYIHTSLFAGGYGSNMFFYNIFVCDDFWAQIHFKGALISGFV